MVIASALAMKISIGTILMSLLPHGIIEIPALILAGAVGFKSVEWLILKVQGKLSVKIIHDCLVIMSIAILLVLVAGLIESNLTPIINGSK